MNKSIGSLLCVLALFVPVCSSAAPPIQTTTRHDDPAVKELEGKYATFTSAAHKGDMAVFRSLRTAEANKAIPQDAKSDELKGMADIMAPALNGFQFVQLETRGNEARMVYKRRNKEGLSFVVQMFEKDAGGWKIGNNSSPDFIGNAPSDAEGLKKALADPVIRFAGK